MNHDFDARMEQLLATLGDLTPGHRERLVRPVRQHDLVCWPDTTDETHAAAMKAAMRVAVHELLDQFCFQLEGVLTRCDSELARTFVLAATSLAMAEGMRVEFCDGGTRSGIGYPGKETLSIEVLADDLLRINYATKPLEDSPPESAAHLDLSINATAVYDDPFVVARELIARLRNRDD